MMKNAKKQLSYWFKVGEHGIMAYVMADSLEEAKNILLEGHKLYNPRKKITMDDIDEMYKFAYTK